MTDNRAISAELMQEYAECSPFCGVLPSPTLSVEGGNPACGDKISLSIELQGERLVLAHFQASGCLISRAAAGLTAELVKGKAIPEIYALGIPQLEDGLGTTFRSRVKCALLPLFVLQQGLKEFSKSAIPGSTFHVSAPRNLGI